MNRIYEKSRMRLDDLGSGFPATQSGIEITILKRLFSQAEAALFVKLSPLPETTGEVAFRLDRDPQWNEIRIPCRHNPCHFN